MPDLRLANPPVLPLLCSRLGRYFLILTLGLIVFVGTQTSLLAQNVVIARAFPLQMSVEKPYALLVVTVWGPDNHAVSGVKVRVRRADQKKPRWEVYSDRRGEAAQRLPPGPGDYVVSAEPKGVKDANGKQLQAGEEVNVHFDKEERQDIGLHLK